MKITLREDIDPDTDFYYDQQFKVYHDPYLIWDKDTWEAVLSICAVYRIDVNGRYAGDVVLEDREKDRKYIVDFSIMPEYQRRGIGKEVLERAKRMGRKLTALTRKETLDFFLKSGFILRKKIRDYYHPGVDGYYITFAENPRSEKMDDGGDRGFLAVQD